MNNHGPTDKNGNCTLCGKNISTGADWTAEAGRPCVGREAKMSDEPKIQRFRVRPTGKHSWEKEFCEDGGNVSFLDVEPYVAAKVEQARREERGRCIKTMVEPLMEAAADIDAQLDAAGNRIAEEGDTLDVNTKGRNKLKRALAAVAKAQEEQP